MKQTKLRICIVTHDFPYPERCGGHTYTSQIARSLSAAGAEVDVFCFSESIEGTKILSRDGVEWHCYSRPAVSRIAQVLSSYPSLSRRNMSLKLQKDVQDFLGERACNVLIFDSFSMGWLCNPLHHQLKGENALIVYQSQNVESDLRADLSENVRGNLLLRLAAKSDARKVKKLERQLYSLSSHVTVITEQDGRRFRDLFGNANTFHFPPGYDGTALTENICVSERGDSLLVLGGRLSTMKQVVLDEMLASSYEECCAKGVSLLVAGELPRDYERRCKSKFAKVLFTGFVEDLNPIVKRCRMGVIADHVGGGFKIRILTHVFNRIPMIATRDAMSGTGLEPGTDYIEIESYSDISNAFLKFRDRIDQLNAMQSSAYSKCEGRYSWSENGNRYHQFLKTALVG